MKKIYKYLFSTLIILYSLLFINYSFAYAADLNVDCADSPSGCTKSGLDPLFSNSLDGVWYPGRTLTKTINLKNSSASSREMDIKPTRTSSSNILEDIIQISIVTNPGGLVIWAGSVTDFYNQTRINMVTFPSEVNQDYNFTASMNSSAGNDYQNMETIFDLTLGFWEESPAPTTSGGDGGGGDGGGGGGGASAPTCNDSVPGSAPTLLSAAGGANSVTLIWSEASDPVTYYLVAYGVSPNNNTYGNPNVGGKGTTSYTVAGLSGGATYCFIVRAGNGCKPGPFSGQICTAPGGGIIAGPAPGFAPGVLGVSTPSASISPEKKTLGVTTISCRCLWWQILLGEIVALLSFYYFLVKKLHKKIKKTAYFGVIIPVLTYLVFLWFNRACFGGFKLMLFIPSNYFFCKYFAVIAAALYTLVTIVWKKYKRKVKIIT